MQEAAHHPAESEVGGTHVEELQRFTDRFGEDLGRLIQKGITSQKTFWWIGRQTVHEIVARRELLSEREESDPGFRLCQGLRTVGNVFRYHFGRPVLPEIDREDDEGGADLCRRCLARGPVQLESRLCQVCQWEMLICKMIRVGQGIRLNQFSRS